MRVALIALFGNRAVVTEGSVQARMKLNDYGIIQPAIRTAREKTNLFDSFCRWVWINRSSVIVAIPIKIHGHS